MNKVRVRFAPSPTGFLHVGGLRSALYDYLFAQKNGGTLILKIEDTDQKRYVEGAVENLIKSLEWAGIKWDEGVFMGATIIENKKTMVEKSKSYPHILEVGEYGPYIQSEKLETYKKHAEKLIKNSQAYYCFCNHHRLEKLRSEQIAEKRAPRYDRCCLNLSAEEVKNNLENGTLFVVRMKIPENETIEINDIIRGKVKFNTSTIDDQIILKSDGYPTYHLASVIDDHEMKITHVIRGEEWLPSIPKHVLLYEYLGWDMPKFAHLPLLVNPDRTKLSKRQGDVAVEGYIQKGYLKEAIINFVALLGWNPGEGSTQEIFSMEELIEKFDINKVHKSGAVFDLQKFDWINSQYIKKLSTDDLYKLSIDFLKPKSFFENASNEKRTEDYVKKVLAIEQERLTNLSGVGESNKFFFRDIECDKELLRWKNMTDEELKENLGKSKNILENISEINWNKKNLEDVLLDAAGENRGEFLWPLRASLTGEQKSPPPFEVAWVLGKNETIKRIKNALESI